MEKTKITVMKNGSLKVEGDFIVLDQEGNEYGIGGHSSNMPFCDGTHKHKGFEHEPKAFDLPPKKTT
jgi:CDGSH-type Zn-finger protein